MKISFSSSVNRSVGIAVLLLGGLNCFGVAGCALVGAQRQGGEEQPIFYPDLPQRPRLQFLRSFVGQSDVEKEQSTFMAALVGTERTWNLSKPSDVASFEGAIYVADTGLGVIAVLDLENQEFSVLGDKGAGSLKQPVAIAIDAQGNKFIADAARNLVMQFDANNNFVKGFGNPESLRPTGVAVDENFVYVVNRGVQQVEVYDRTTRQIERVIVPPEDEGGFNVPTKVDVDPQGHIYVTDALNFRVVEFDPDGNFVKSFGWQGKTPGTFARPRGLAVDRSNHLYIVDGLADFGQIFDTNTAQVMMIFGGPGKAPGQMYLPSDVSIDYAPSEYFRQFVAPGFELEYLVLVANNYGPNKIAVYGFVNPIDPSRFDQSVSEKEN